MGKTFRINAKDKLYHNDISSSKEEREKLKKLKKKNKLNRRVKVKKA